MTDSPAVEIRRNDDGSVDEIVAKGCDVHIEQMRENEWCMVIEAAGGYWRFWIGAKNGHTRVDIKCTEAATADVIP